MRAEPQHAQPRAALARQEEPANCVGFFSMWWLYSHGVVFSERETTENNRRTPFPRTLMMATSLVLAVKPSLLFIETVLASIEHQTYMEFEAVFVADSAPSDVIRYLESRIRSLSIPARIVYAQDARSTDTPERNTLRCAVAAAGGSMIIFSDTVSILHPRFVEMHVAHQAAQQHKGTILTGARVELSADVSAELSAQAIRSGWPGGSIVALLADGIFGQTTYALHAVFLPWHSVQEALATRAQDVYAANYSLHKSTAESLLEFLDSENAPNAKLLLSRRKISIRCYRNTFVQYRCNEPGSAQLLRVSGVLERVQQLRLAVPEMGLRPAMNTAVTTAMNTAPSAMREQL
ncbi:MAG: hypothetical protein RL156_378 [Bacteroidota bacterium]